MLAHNAVVGFIATRSPEKARDFYENTLGLEFESADPFATVFRSKGIRIRVTRVQKFEPLPFTVLGWEVDDITRYVIALKARGVTFEIFAGLDQNELGIWNAPSGARIAWFKDPDGNLLSISEY